MIVERRKNNVRTYVSAVKIRSGCAMLCYNGERRYCNGGGGGYGGEATSRGWGSQLIKEKFGREKDIPGMRKRRRRSSFFRQV